MMKLIKENRESYHYKFFEWAYPIMDKIVKDNKLGYDMDYIKENVRISTSWAYRSKKGVMGTTMESQGSAKNFTEITVSPNYNSNKDYFGTMIHEFVHAICFTLNHCGHDKKHFGGLARLFCLEGKLTECGYSAEMWELFNIDEFMEINGAYKDIHARVMTHYRTNDEGNIIDDEGNEILDENGNPQKPKSSGKPKQTTRLLKAECKEHGYSVRLSKKCVLIGLPLCPICKNNMILEVKE